MKRLVVLLSISLLLVTGCSVQKLSNTDITNNIKIILSDNTKIYNANFEGYKYYVPKRLKFINKDDYNAYFRDKFNDKYYLYIDIISYYHKVESNYQVNKKAYYSKVLSYNDKTGYIEINKVDNKYFIEYMYDYAKVEAYVEKDKIVYAIDNISSILRSIKYNNKIIDSLVGSNVLNYKEENFSIFKSKSSGDKFLDYVKEYDKGTSSAAKDEEQLEIDIEK